METDQNNAPEQGSGVNVNTEVPGDGFPQGNNVGTVIQDGVSALKPENTYNAPEVPEVQPEPTEEAPASHPDDLQAATERLKQQTARNNKLLSALGVDPMSDIAEQLESGVITPDMVRQHVAAQYQPSVQAQPAGVQPNQQVQSSDPVAMAQARLTEAKAKYNAEAEEGGVSLDTNSALLDSIQALNDAKLDQVTQKFEGSTRERRANEAVDAVLNVARQSVPGYEQMPENVRREADQVSLAMTGVIADREALQMGFDPANLTPQQVQYFANKAQTELKGLTDHFMALGAQSVRNGIRPNPVNNNLPVVPAGGTGTPVAPVNRFAGANISNHEDLARKWLAENGQI